MGIHGHEYQTIARQDCRWGHHECRAQRVRHWQAEPDCDSQAGMAATTHDSRSGRRRILTSRPAPTFSAFRGKTSARICRLIADAHDAGWVNRVFFPSFSLPWRGHISFFSVKMASLGKKKSTEISVISIVLHFIITHVTRSHISTKFLA